MNRHSNDERCRAGSSDSFHSKEEMKVVSWGPPTRASRRVGASNVHRMRRRKKRGVDDFLTWECKASLLCFTLNQDKQDKDTKYATAEVNAESISDLYYRTHLPVLDVAVVISGDERVSRVTPRHGADRSGVRLNLFMSMGNSKACGAAVTIGWQA